MTNPSVLARTFVLGPQLAFQIHTIPATYRQKDPPSPVLFVSRFPYDLTVTQLKHTFPGCTAASIVPRKPKRKPKPKKPKALTPRQMKKKVVSTRNPTKARKWKPPSDDDVGLGRQGYVEFGSIEEATKALKKTQNLIIGIRRLNVQYASPTSVIPHQERAKLLEERRAAAEEAARLSNEDGKVETLEKKGTSV